jgi:hypothetical protein
VNNIQTDLSETVRSQAGNQGKVTATTTTATSRRVATPEVITTARSRPNVLVKEARKTSSPVQGVSSLLGISAESAEAVDDTAVDVDEIFLRAIDIRL